MIYTLISHPKLTQSKKWLHTNHKLLTHYKTKINLFTKSKCKSPVTKSNQALQESESKLTAQITFLKEQVTAFWQNSTDDKHMANSNAIQQPETSTSSEDTTPGITAENRSETPRPQMKEIVTPPNIITPNIPTKNRFLPLQNSMNESDTLPDQEDIDQNPKINSP